MKNLKFITLAIAILGFTSISFAQTNSATANSSARIITPIIIENTGSLDFGNIIVGSGGSVTVNSDDTDSRTLSGVTTTNLEGTISSAKFKVTGLAGSTYSITKPSDTDVTLALEGTPGTTMAVQSFIVTAIDGTLQTLGSATLGANGVQNIAVGATLVVPAGQAPGLYNGSFAITVNYN